MPASRSRNEVNRTVSSASLSRHLEDGLFLKLCKVRGEKPCRVCRERIIKMLRFARGCASFQ